MFSSLDNEIQPCPVTADPPGSSLEQRPRAARSCVMMKEKGKLPGASYAPILVPLLVVVVVIIVEVTRLLRLFQQATFLLVCFAGFGQAGLDLGWKTSLLFGTRQDFKPQSPDCSFF